MIGKIGAVLRMLGLHKAVRSLYDFVRGNYLKQFFLKLYLPFDQRKVFINKFDPVRYGSIFLAIRRIEEETIEGNFAEVGVFQGHTSKFIHDMMPDRTLYLFDTFAGFSANDLEGRDDNRFRSTSLEMVKQKLGDARNVVFRSGYFPDSAKGLEENRFAFVMLDVDVYEPTLAGLTYFYPRMTPGGYIFVHDYNSPESEYAIRRAVKKFMQDKPEKLIELPDIAGSIVIRKLNLPQ
jgi:O-methyltransferase